jgi:hypothetical protein
MRLFVVSPNELWFSIDFVLTLFFEDALWLDEGSLVCGGLFAASFAHGLAGGPGFTNDERERPVAGGLWIIWRAGCDDGSCCLLRWLLLFLDVDIKRSRTRSRIRGTLNRIRGTDTNSPITAFSRHFSVIRGIEERMEQRSKTNNNNRQPSKQWWPWKPWQPRRPIKPVSGGSYTYT